MTNDTAVKPYPYALVIATPIGPRSKKDPKYIVVGEDSIHPDCDAQQYSPDAGPHVIAGKYTDHPVPWLTGRQAHCFAYLIRAGSFTPEEVLKMAESLR